jgi:Polysaccharide lyase/IPT/TIG domain
MRYAFRRRKSHLLYGLVLLGVLCATLAVQTAQARYVDRQARLNTSGSGRRQRTPTITGFTPTSGSATTVVTVTGSNFTAVNAVAFNGTKATYTVNSTRQIQATVPNSATTGPISVSTSAGTAKSRATFTITSSAPANPPKITGFNPSSGALGTTVTISGSNLAGATAVTFNGTNASYTLNSSSQVTATVPSGATSGPISVHTAAGSAASSSSFSVTAPSVPLPAPTVTNFSPTSGAPGTTVTIAGANLSGTVAVAFNGTSATYTVNSSSEITAAVPTGSTTGPITVTTSAGTATSTESFQTTQNLQPTWTGGFETGDLSEWDGSWQEAPGRFTAVSSDGGVIPREGAYMGRVEVQQGDDPINTGGNICEVYRTHYDTVGDDRYYSVSVYLPNGFPYVPNSLFNYFYEVHGDNGAQAPFKIGINSIISGPNPSVGFVAELETGDSSSPTQTLWRLGNLVTGQWVDFVVHVRWERDTTGIVQVWMNGTEIVNATGIQTFYTNDMTKVRVQAGYYRADYSKTAILYLDAMKIGDSYASVTP